jgi:hypothetical protein
VSDPRSNFVGRAVEWLRAGYPTGVPRQDYVALLGLLRRKLTDAEIHAFAQDLADQAEGGQIARQDVEDLIQQATLQPATDEDIARVAARLAAGGWPLADPPAVQETVG